MWSDVLRGWQKRIGQRHHKVKYSITEIDEFLKSNRHLFTLIGVFGAISIYLKRFSGEETSILVRLGVTSGFLMVLLLSTVVVFKLYDSLIRKNALLSLQGLFSLSFLIFLFPVLLAIIGAILQFQDAILLFGVFSLNIAILLSAFLIHTRTSESVLDEYRPHLAVLLFVFTLTNVATNLVIHSITGIETFDYISGYEHTTLEVVISWSLKGTMALAAFSWLLFLALLLYSILEFLVRGLCSVVRERIAPKLE